MGSLETLAHAATELGNHVAAFIRFSNTLAGVLKDGDRDDLDGMTRRMLLRAMKTEHDEFRAEHFRGLVDSLNTVVSLADAMYQAEPVSAEPLDETTIPDVAMVGDAKLEPDAKGADASPS